ncbi:BON domain-containing protein [Egibacter rhizosphaerae]|uniref:BON domain-containing protein n=1 Tax=Egibacter rhizosphaerae TaxID=1670831 RepID=UPI0013F17826|nr:BON domain-containing protein [Egibacter rhizosphaerae]
MAKLRSQAKDLRNEARKIAKEADLDERASELTDAAQDLAERVRDSDTLARASGKGAELAGVAAEKGGELASRAKDRFEESGLDERAQELAEQIRKSDQYKHARETAGEASDKALSKVGDWLSHSPAADKLGVEPKKKRRSRVLVAVLGALVGFIGGLAVGARKSETVEEVGRLAGRVGQDTPDIGAPAAQKDIEDEVRTRLGEDPRTAELPKLNVNVAEGTVFVRGSVPDGTDHEVVRAVISTVPGVEDIDLQLTSVGASN